MLKQSLRGMELKRSLCGMVKVAIYHNGMRDHGVIQYDAKKYNISLRNSIFLFYLYKLVEQPGTNSKWSGCGSPPKVL